MKASYIYVPEASFQNQDEDIVQFFKKIFSQIKIVNDPAFQVTMYQYFISCEFYGLISAFAERNESRYENSRDKDTKSA